MMSDFHRKFAEIGTTVLMFVGSLMAISVLIFMWCFVLGMFPKTIRDDNCVVNGRTLVIRTHVIDCPYCSRKIDYRTNEH